MGVFIHYGPTSSFAAASDAEWITRLRAGEAEALTPGFEPDPRVVGTWIEAAVAAQASYLTVTMKHHDGFCLWASQHTDAALDGEHDLLDAVAQQSRSAGLRLFVYYSILDLHEPTFGRSQSAYSKFVQAQMSELLMHYGPLAGIWFDWPVADALPDRLLQEVYALIHRLQPWALVGTNHQRGHLLAGEDFQIFEESFPPAEPATPADAAQQAAFKLGRTWFWSGVPEPTDGYGFERLRAQATDMRISLLVNVAPRPDGVVPDSVIRALVASRCKAP